MRLINFILAILLVPSILISQKIDSEVSQALQEDEKVNVLIEFNNEVELRTDLSSMTKVQKGTIMYNHLTSVVNESQKEVRKYLEKHSIPFSSFYIVNAISAKITFAEAKEIAQYEKVKIIMPDAKIKNPLPEAATQSQRAENRMVYTYGLEKIGIPEIWNSTGKKGENVVIGGQDTGYDWEHPALKPAYRGSNNSEIDHNYSWHDAITEPIDTSEVNICGYGTLSPCDDHGHGTHTMGTMAGSDVAEQIFGIAPEAQWIGCRNMDDGIGRPSTYLECFEWFLAPTDLNRENPRPALAPDVINNSWGCPEFEGCNPSNFHLLEEAVNNLTNAGILTVVSAGNNGSRCSSVESPAAIYENSFTVGAVNENSDVASFSSRGPVAVDSSFRTKPDVVAPGVNVFSSTLNDDYRYSSGTSMAGPHTAGLAALLISIYPDLKGQPRKIMEILEQSALPLSPDTSNCYQDEIPNNIWGYGLIHGLEAISYYDSTTTAINPISTFKVKIYPTVTSDKVNIISENTDNDLTLKVWNSMGQIIYKNDINQHHYQFNVSNLPSGSYFYRLSTQKKYKTGKLMIL